MSARTDEKKSDKAGASASFALKSLILSPPIGAAKFVAEKKYLKPDAPVRGLALQGLRGRGLGSGLGGAAGSLAAGSLYIDGLKNLSSRKKDDRRLGMAQVLASGAVYDAVKGVSVGALEASAAGKAMKPAVRKGLARGVANIPVGLLPGAISALSIAEGRKSDSKGGKYVVPAVTGAGIGAFTAVGERTLADAISGDIKAALGKKMRARALGGATGGALNALAGAAVVNALLSDKKKTAASNVYPLLQRLAKMPGDAWRAAVDAGRRARKAREEFITYRGIKDPALRSWILRTRTDIPLPRRGRLLSDLVDGAQGVGYIAERGLRENTGPALAGGAAMALLGGALAGPAGAALAPHSLGAIGGVAAAKALGKVKLNERSLMERLIYSDANDSNPLIAAHGRITDRLVNAALGHYDHPLRQSARAAPSLKDLMKVQTSYADKNEGERAAQRVARAWKLSREEDDHQFRRENPGLMLRNTRHPNDKSHGSQLLLWPQHSAGAATRPDALTLFDLPHVVNFPD